MEDNSIIIVGGGTSLKNFKFDKLKDVKTIVVNKSLFTVPNPDYFITMDYSFTRKTYNKIDDYIIKVPNRVFIANFTHSYLKELRGAIVDTRYPLTYELWRFNIIIKSYQSGGFGYTFREFCTGENSGYCALQFAILMGYNPIYLLGFDLNTEENQTHYHEGYGESLNKFENKLNLYYQFFKKGFEQIKKDKPNLKIYSLSPNSKLNEFIPCKYGIFKDWWHNEKS